MTAALTGTPDDSKCQNVAGAAKDIHAEDSESHNKALLGYRGHILCHSIQAAMTASELGFDVFIIDDACAAWSQEIHVNSLQSFTLLFGYVMTTEEALARFGEKLIRK